MQLLWEYTDQMYGHQIEESYDICPYDLDFADEEFVYKQVCTWFMFERKDRYGQTVVDEFVDKFVSNQYLRAKILQTKNLTYDTFYIEKSIDADGIIQARSESNGKVFRIKIMSGGSIYVKGKILSGRIYPWDEDGTYRANGILKITNPHDEILDKLDFDPREWEKIYQEEIESVAVTVKSMSHTLLNKLPAVWIYDICDALGIHNVHLKKDKIFAISKKLTSKDELNRVIDGLPKKEKSALEFILKKSGVVKHAELCRQIGPDDTKLYWDGKSLSTIANLRRRGLLIVGKMLINNTRYKVAIIPVDIFYTIHTTKEIQNILKSGNAEKVPPNKFKIIQNSNRVM